MDIKTIPLSALQADPLTTLNECADSGCPLLIELPDHRLIAMQAVESADDNDLIDNLLASSASFQALVAKSKAGPRKPFVAGSNS